MAKNVDNHLYSVVVFVDLIKAFGSVDHRILLRKLEMYGITGTSLKWFQSYVCSRKQSRCVMLIRDRDFSQLWNCLEVSRTSPIIYLFRSIY